MNGIVDTPVVRTEATEHLIVRGVDDGVAFQRGNVALPQVNIGLDGREVGKVGHALLKCFLAQIFVLHPQKLRVAGYRHPHIEKRTEQALLRLLLLWNGQILPSFP